MMLQRKKLRIVTSILVLFLLKTEGAEEYDDEDKPYEFGFNVEVEGKKQQHRHEEKNEDGIIKGEFGFITADDVYHVTVYAIDKEGDYKILSTKNINIKNLKPTRTSGSIPARQGHFLQLTTPIASALTVSAGAIRSTKTSTHTEYAVTDKPAKSTVPNISTSLLTTIVAGDHPTNTTPTEATKKSYAPVVPMAFTPLATLFPDTTIVTPTVASAAMSTPVTLIAPLASTGPVIEATVTTPSTLTKPETNITYNTVDLPATYPKPAKTPTLVTSTMATLKLANPTTKKSLSTPSTVIEPTVRIGPITSTTPAVSTTYDEPPKPTISTAPITLTAMVSSDGTTVTEIPGLAMSIGTTAPITDINETITATSFKPYSLEPLEKSCAGCSIPTTTPVTPLIGLRSNFAPDDTDSSGMPVLPGAFPNITQNTTTTQKPKGEQLKDSPVSDAPTTLLNPNQSTQNVADLNTLVIPKTLSNYDHPGLPALVEQIHRQDPIRNSSSLVPKKAQTKSEPAHTQRSKTREELQLDSMQSTKSPIPSKLQDTIHQNSNSIPLKLNSTNPRLRPSNVPQNSKDSRTSRGPQRLSSQDDKQTSNSLSSVPSSNAPDIPQSNVQQKSNNPVSTRNSKTLGEPQQNSNRSTPVPTNSQGLPTKGVQQNSTTPSPTHGTQDSNDMSPNLSSNMLNKPQRKPIQNSNDSSSGQSNSPDLPSPIVGQNSDYPSSTESSTKSSSTTSLPRQNVQNNAKDPTQSFNTTNELEFNSMQKSNGSPVVKSRQNITQNLNKPSSNQSSNSPSLPREKMQQNSKDPSATNILDKPKENPTEAANDSSLVQSKSQSLPRQDIKQNINNASPTQSSDTSNSPQHNGIQNSNPIQNANGTPSVQSNSLNLPSQGVKQNSDYPSSTESSNTPSTHLQNTKDPSPTQSSNTTNELELDSKQNSNDSSVVKSRQNITQNLNKPSSNQSSNSPSLPREKAQQNSKDPFATNILDKPKENSNDSSPVQSKSQSLPRQDIKQNINDASPTQSSNTSSSPQHNGIQNSNPIQNANGAPLVRSNSPNLPSQGVKQNSDYPSSTESSNAPSSPQQNTKDPFNKRNEPQLESMQNTNDSSVVKSSQNMTQNSNRSSSKQSFNSPSLPQEKTQQNSKDPSATNILDKLKENSMQNVNNSPPVQIKSQSLLRQDVKENLTDTSPTQSSDTPSSPQQNVSQNSSGTSLTEKSKMLGKPQQSSIQNSSDSPSVQNNSSELPSQGIKQNSDSPSLTKSSTAPSSPQKELQRNSKDPSATRSLKSLDKPKQNLNQNSTGLKPVQGDSQSLTPKDNKQNPNNLSPTQTSEASIPPEQNVQGNLKDLSPTESSNKIDVTPQNSSDSSVIDSSQELLSKNGAQNSNTPSPTQSSKLLRGSQRYTMQNSPSLTPSSIASSEPRKDLKVPSSDLNSLQKSNSTSPTKSTYPRRGSVRYVPQNISDPSPQKSSTSPHVSQQRIPKQDRGPMKYSGPKPQLVSVDLKVVDKNTDIHSLSPGEKQGLPDGLNSGDMSKILYTFNYTVGFHGHFEQGYTNGTKKGYYYVTGRNGIRTRIDYTADNTGFHPKVSQEVLDLLSDDVPKPETEKDAKFGLKNNEFKWLYFPDEPKKRKRNSL